MVAGRLERLWVGFFGACSSAVSGAVSLCRVHSGHKLRRQLTSYPVKPVTDAQDPNSLDDQLSESEQDSRADSQALLMIFGAAVLIAVYYISGWTPFI